MRKKDDRIFKKKSDKNGVYGNQSNSRKERNKRIRRQKDAGKEKNRRSSVRKVSEYTLKNYLAWYILLPFVLVFLYECLGYKSLTGGAEFLFRHPAAYLCNMMIIIASFSIALLFRKRTGIILTITLIWTFCAFGNFVLLCNRVTPLTGNDLVLVTDLFGIVAKYLNTFETVLVIGIIIASIIGIVLVFIKVPYACRKVNYLKSILIICCIGILTWGSFMVGWSTGGVETQFHELSQSYLKNGFVYCFVNSLLDVGIRRPDNYSPEVVETLVESEQSSDPTEKETEPLPDNINENPNIIIVQLESFFNVNRLKNVTFSENPIANFTRLMEENGSGFFNVPVIGAGTVNTEFEVLTGMNIDDFGAGEYPYKTILKEKACESLPFNLRANGYSSHAIHNHVGSFYSRNYIYCNLGFDTFTSLEYMWPRAYTAMSWAKDVVITEEVKKAMDSTEGSDFVYAVSVQGHGSYPSDPETMYERHVTVTSNVIEDESYLNQISYYVNQLYEMDQFVGELVAMLEEQNENTILVMYGDHLPSLSLTNDNLISGNIYQTEYFIWNNMGLSFDDDNLEAYKIGSRIMEALNIQDGVINSYHQKYGKQLAASEITEETYLSGLKALEYDILYGDQLCYNGINPYEPVEMQMGINPICITDIMENGTGGFKVHGENFTKYSKVYVNDEPCGTWYYSSMTLEVRDVELEPGDVVTVWQKSLSSTEPYIFKPELVESESESASESETETTSEVPEE